MLKLNRRANEPPYYLDLPAPTPLQMKNVVKGGDRYRIQTKGSWFWAKQVGYAVMILFLFILSFGALFVIAEVVGQ